MSLFEFLFATLSQNYVLERSKDIGQEVSGEHDCEYSCAKQFIPLK